MAAEAQMPDDNWKVLDAIDVVVEFLGPERAAVLVELVRDTLAEIVEQGRDDAS